MAMLLLPRVRAAGPVVAKLEDPERPAVAGTALSGIKACLGGNEQEHDLLPPWGTLRAPEFLVFWHPFCISKAKLVGCSMCVKSHAFERDSRVRTRSKDSPRPLMGAAWLQQCGV
jgi:hypothetical protein